MPRAAHSIASAAGPSRLTENAVAASLSSLRGVSADHPAVGIDAALVALSGRLRLREGCNRSAEDIVTELWQQVFAPPTREGGDQGKATAPTGASKA